jgi:hypothetical protein
MEANYKMISSNIQKFVHCGVTAVFVLLAGTAFASEKGSCKDLPDHAALKAALKKVVVAGDAKANGSFAMNMGQHGRTRQHGLRRSIR